MEPRNSETRTDEMIRVHAPDGSVIHFPSGMPDEEISAVMAKEYPAFTGGVSGSWEEQGPIRRGWESFKDWFHYSPLNLTNNDFMKSIMEKETIPMGSGGYFSMMPPATPQAEKAATIQVNPGALHGTARFAEDLSSPYGMLSMAAFGQLARMGFLGWGIATGVGAKQVHDSIQHFLDAQGIEDPNEMTSEQTQAMFHFLMGAGILKHSGTPRRGEPLPRGGLVDTARQKLGGATDALLGKKTTSNIPTAEAPVETPPISPVIPPVAAQKPISRTTPSRDMAREMAERQKSIESKEPWYIERDKLEAERRAAYEAEQRSKVPDWSRPAGSREFDAFGQVEPEVVPMVRDAVKQRMNEIYDLFTSGTGELSGKGKNIEGLEGMSYEASQGVDTGFGKIRVRDTFPELQGMKGWESPAKLREAIEKDADNPLYLRIKDRVTKQVFDDYADQIAQRNEWALEKREAPSEEEWARQQFEAVKEEAKPEGWDDSEFLTPDMKGGGEEGFALIRDFPKSKGDRSRYLIQRGQRLQDEAWRYPEGSAKRQALLRKARELHDFAQDVLFNKPYKAIRRGEEIGQLEQFKKGEEGFADIGKGKKFKYFVLKNEKGEYWTGYKWSSNISEAWTDHTKTAAGREAILRASNRQPYPKKITTEIIDRDSPQYEEFSKSNIKKAIDSIYEREEGFANVSDKDQKGFDFKPMDIEGASKEQGMKDLMKQVLQAPDSNMSKRELLNLDKKKKSKKKKDAEPEPLLKNRGLF